MVEYAYVDTTMNAVVVTASDPALDGITEFYEVANETDPNDIYIAGGAVRVKPPKPSELSTWDGTNNVWVTPNASEAEALFVGAEYKAYGVSISFNQTTKVMSFSGGFAYREKGLNRETKNIPTANFTYVVGSGARYYYFDWVTGAVAATVNLNVISYNPKNILLADFDGALLKNGVERSLLDPSQFISKSINSALLGDLSVESRSLANGAINHPDKLGNGVIKGSHVQAGAMGAREIAAEQISSKHLVVSDWTNLVADDQIQDISMWNGFPTGTGSHVFINANYGALTPAAQSKGAFIIAPKSNTVTTIISRVVPAKAGEEYLVSCRTGATGPMNVQLRVQFLDAAYVSLAGNGSGNKTTAVFETLSASFVAPANTAYVRMYFQVNANGYATTGGNSSPHIVFAAPQMRRKNGGELIVDGGITGTHLAATNIISKTGQLDDLIVSRIKIANGSITDGGTLRVESGMSGYTPFQNNYNANWIPNLVRIPVGLGPDMFNSITMNVFIEGGNSITSVVEPNESCYSRFAWYYRSFRTNYNSSTGVYSNVATLHDFNMWSNIMSWDTTGRLTTALGGDVSSGFIPQLRFGTGSAYQFYSGQFITVQLGYAAYSNKHTAGFGVRKRIPAWGVEWEGRYK